MVFVFIYTCAYAHVIRYGYHVLTKRVILIMLIFVREVTINAIGTLWSQLEDSKFMISPNICEVFI